jgi:hypothetical protein
MWGSQALAALKPAVKSNKDNFKHVVKAVPAIARVMQRNSVVNGASFLWARYDRIN